MGLTTQRQDEQRVGGKYGGGRRDRPLGMEPFPGPVSAYRANLAAERAESQLSSSGQRLLRAFEGMPMAFLSLDRSLRVTFANAEGERLLSASEGSMVGRRLSEVFPASARSGLEAGCGHVLESGQSATFEEYNPARHIWFEVHVWWDMDGLNVFVSDVTRRHDVDRLRAEELRSAKQSNSRLRILTEVSAQIAGASSGTDVLQRLTRVMVPQLADWCTVVVPADSELVRVAAWHHDPVLNGLAQRLVGSYPHRYGGPSPGVVVYRSGKPLQLDHLARRIGADLDDSAASAAYGRTLQLLGDGPGLIMPIISRGEVAAVLTLVRSQTRPFLDQDVNFISEVVARVAPALESAGIMEMQREAASALQAAALPQSLPVFDRVRLAAGYRVASRGSKVGGDWYDAFALNNGRIALVVGDAAGHGVQAAAVMAQVRNALRSHLFESVNPAESLNRVSRFLAAQEPKAFATVVCAEIDQLTGELVWASAGHPPPLLVHRKGTSEYLRGDPAPPMGWSGEPGIADAIQHRVTIRPGDRLILFSDGLFERRRVHLDIGLAHLMIVAEQTHAEPDPERACQAILREMLADDIHDDDVCLLVADFDTGL